MSQLLALGIFKAEINKEALASKYLTQETSFILKNEKDITLNISDLKGKVVFINFWASWCPPCRAEMPSINNLYKWLKIYPRFVFLLVDEDEDKKRETIYIQKNNFSFPVYNIVAGVPAKIYSGTLPTTVVLNKRGQIVYKHEGIASYGGQDFISQLRDVAETN
ncbi:MAG: hypothetical protein NVSMB67_27770 [Flavisolibacter sp.]